MASNPLLDLVPEAIRTLAPYHVPRFPGVRAKLDANEFPLPLPEDIARELGEVLSRVAINRYPAADGGRLRIAVADRLGVHPGQLVFGNGSDELIQLMMAAFGRPRPGRQQPLVLYPTPTFIWFRLAAYGAGAEPLEVPLGPDFELDVDRTRRVMGRERPNVAFFARPNNPTGTLWPSAEIASLAREHRDVLIVSDEAYAEYCGDSMLDRLGALPNLVVMRTFSKVGLAGLRVGYLVAAPEIVAEIEKVRPPYNLGSLNQAAALWIMENHPELLSARCADVVAERERLSVELASIPGLRIYPSQANLILIQVGTPGDGQAGQLWQKLAERGVLIRNLDRPGPLAGCLRITVGTPVETNILLDELRHVLG
jgi:histidinol-phosphate aminotransferase